jgi:nucleotidyltransferase substrate binding protein (TIGR01987 family)
MNENSLRSLENFEKAVNKLEEFLRAPITEDRDKAGIIQAFEFSFELSWKTIQKMTAVHGKTVGSAKQAFRAAFELGWIKESEHEQYIMMIDDRNLTSHTYKEDLANQILVKIQTQHFKVLKNLLLTLKHSTQRPAI